MLNATVRTAALLLLILTASARGDDHAWLADGKAATVLVDLGEDGSGSGFCIDKAGLFVTNRHVIVDTLPGAVVKVIVNPSEAGQRTLSAHVVAKSAEFDLAILKVDDPGALTALTLGSDATIAETDVVTAFGYPFGKMLADHAGEYPGVSVNTGKVTSLRRNAGKLARLQIDAAVNPGNSGGPVLDSAGKVVGVVVSGVRMGGQSGVNFAIPVSKLKAFLEPAYVGLKSPAATYDNRHDEAEFVASVFQFDKPTTDVSVDLILKSTGAPDRTIALKRKPDGTFAASAAAVVAPPDGAVVPISALTERGLVRGWVKDHDIQIGADKVRLADMKSIDLLPLPHSSAVDGRNWTSPVTGLGSITGPDGQPVDLSTAVRVKLDDPTPPDAVVQYTIKATRGGKKLAEASGSFTLTGAPGIKAGPPKATESEKDESSDDTAGTSLTTVQFPPEIDDAFAGGGGAFEIVHLSELQAYAIFDVAAGRVTGWIPAANSSPSATAGQTELIVATDDRRRLSRYDLKTGKLIGTVVPPRSVEISALAMGDDSNGPLILKSNLPEAMVLDWPTGREIPPTWSGGLMAWSECRVSPDGSTLLGWRSGEPFLCRDHLGVDAVTGRSMFRPVELAVPNYDGTIAIIDGESDDRWLKGPADRERFKRVYPTRSLSINAEASMDMSESGFSTRLMLVNAGDGKPLCPFPPMPDMQSGNSENSSRDDKKSDVDEDRRWTIDPAAGRMVLIPPSDDQVVVFKFDLAKSLKSTGGDWLVVLSNPPTTFSPGKRWTYAVNAQSSAGPQKYSIVTGPVGMTVTSDGTVSWTPDRADPVPVVLEVNDSSGKPVRQSFMLRPDRTMGPLETRLLQLQSKVHAGPADADSARQLAVWCLVQMDDPSLLAADEASLTPATRAILPLVRKPMETLTDAEARQVGEWFEQEAAAAPKDLHDAVAARAGRYLMLYLALHNTEDADRAAVRGRVEALPLADQVDVLARLKEVPFVVAGDVTSVDDGIKIAKANSHPRTYTTLRCRGSYRLSTTFTPGVGNGEADMVFGVGQSAMSVSFGGWGGALGLVDIKGHGLKEDRVETRPWKLKRGHFYHTDIYVILDGPDVRITIDVDGKTVLHWSGSQADITPQANTWQLPSYIGVALSANDADIIFHSATMTPIDGGAVPVSRWAAHGWRETPLAGLSLPAGVTHADQDLTVTAAAKLVSVPLVVFKQFDRLAGSVKAPAGVTCSISCDGVVKWRSSSAKADSEQPFEVDLREVEKVECITTGGAATWVNPRLGQTDQPNLDPHGPMLTATVACKKPVQSPLIGGSGGGEFHEVFPDGGILVGLRISYMRENDNWAIQSVQAVYVTPDGAYHTGAVHGTIGTAVTEQFAPPGYAIGEIDATGARLLDGFRLRYMRIGSDKLEVDETSDYGGFYGKNGVDGESLTKLAGTGKPIIGLFGRCGWGVDAFGVLTTP